MYKLVLQIQLIVYWPIDDDALVPRTICISYSKSSLKYIACYPMSQIAPMPASSLSPSRPACPVQMCQRNRQEIIIFSHCPFGLPCLQGPPIHLYCLAFSPRPACADILRARAKDNPHSDPPMNLENLLKQKIVDDVLSIYPSSWTVLVYDASVAMIIRRLFSRTDLLSYNIMYCNHIEEERQEWDFPVIYFLSCSKENSRVINSEFAAHKYSSFQVCSLTQPEGLDEIIKAKVVLLNIMAIEERIFNCMPENLTSLSNVLNVNFRVNYMPATKELAESVKKACAHEKRSDARDASLLIVNRAVDLFSPLMHFFTFKSALAETNGGKFEEGFGDPVFPELRYKHLAEVSGVLQFHVNRLNRNVADLNKKKVDTTSLGKMVIDAPKNIEVKEAVQKYSNHLKGCLKRLEDLKPLVEAEQLLATDFDSNGRRTKKTLDYFLKIIGSTRFEKTDKLRLLYLLKARNISFTQAETKILRNIGFLAEDIDATFETGMSIKRESAPEFTYDMSRYEPILSDLVRGYVGGKAVFQSIGAAPVEVNSLRKTFMISSQKKSVKRIVVAYVTGGLSVEECRIAYSLSEQLGIELFCGSETMITPGEFIETLKKAKSLK